MSNIQHKNSSLIQDKEYLDWIAELSRRLRQSQVKAAVRINQEMLRFYWSIGKDISERQMDRKYGSHFYENLSRDLMATLQVKKVFRHQHCTIQSTFIGFIPRFLRIFSNLLKN